MNPEVPGLAQFTGISVLSWHYKLSYPSLLAFLSHPAKSVPQVPNLCQDQRVMRFEFSQQWDHPTRLQTRNLSLTLMAVGWV